MKLNNTIKNTGLLLFGIPMNGYCIFHSVKANDKWNKYLATLSENELEKVQAREWYLRKNGRFFGSGFVLGERVELNNYNALSEKEKESVLTRYRWSQVK